jgi:hypothetical protein
MDHEAIQALSTCLRMVLDDEPWQDFGFSKRPRYGAWLQRFRAKWRVELEKTVLQQMLSALTAAYIVSGKVPKDFAEAAASAYTSSPDIATALGFSSHADDAIQLKEAINKYISSAPDEWPQILNAYIRPHSLPDKQLGARLFLGCAQFGISAKNMIGVLKWKTT